MRESSPGARESRSPEFGSLLRKLRSSAGLSQDGLAERAGISSKTIGALEQGARRAAHDDTIHRLAAALQLPTGERDALLQAAQYSRARRTGRAEDTPRGNLPSPLTSFVERREVQDIVDLLDDNRLVTITGMAGAGKTRTAIEAARRATAPNISLWFLDLSRLRQGNSIVLELASILGISAINTDDAWSAVTHYLEAHRARLVLDNCEHLVDDVATLVPRLLQACPSLSILATSREILSLSFEVPYQLQALDVPEGGVATVEEALDYSGMRLFLARAESDRATWLHKPSSLGKVGQLCRQLDGIPLAIELAASRIATLGLDMLLKDLASGLALSGKRDFPDRHQTMAATIAWSYDLLDAAEQALFRRLSIFAGTFTLDVVQRVCSDSAVLPSFAIVDACHRLAQKSLIVVADSDPVRYRLLNCIRAFGESRLSAGERDTLQSNYTQWLLELSEAMHYNRPGLSIASLVNNFDNVRAEVDRCLKRGGERDVLDAAAIVGGCRRLWIVTKRRRELKRYVEHLLARLDSDSHPHLASRLLLAMSTYIPPGPSRITFQGRFQCSSQTGITKRLR